MLEVDGRRTDQLYHRLLRPISDGEDLKINIIDRFIHRATAPEGADS